MADTTTAETGFAPIPLLANSYDFQALEKATLHAENLKTESGQRDAFNAIATSQALNQEVIEGLTAPAVPEGTELAEVEGADGRVVMAPVAIPDEPAPAAAPTRRTRGDAPTED